MPPRTQSARSAQHAPPGRRRRITSPEVILLLVVARHPPTILGEQAIDLLNSIRVRTMRLSDRSTARHCGTDALRRMVFDNLKAAHDV